MCFSQPDEAFQRGSFISGPQQVKKKKKYYSAEIIVVELKLNIREWRHHRRREFRKMGKISRLKLIKSEKPTELQKP